MKVTGVGGVILDVTEWGSRSDPTIVLVHGFPDDHSVWNSIADLLSDRFHIVAFDVRGAGRSSRPRRVREYALTYLDGDLKAVARALSPHRRVHLVGHDWGSVQAWHSATQAGADALFASLTSISGGSLDHVPTWVGTRLRSGRDGRRAVLSMWKSPFYMGFLAAPLLARLACRAGLTDLTIEWAHRFEVGRRPDHLGSHRARRNHASSKIYTANLFPKLARPTPRRNAIPTRVIAPTSDFFITPHTSTLGKEWSDDFTVHEVDGGHWAAAFNPLPIAESIADHVGSVEARGPQPKEVIR
ncbi:MULTISPECIES: alpha/beta fold hydrolase [Nocardiaceae]|uniref:alpha/beta fold hydrolase n=1 Tax=Nocardiaceae TaxID=85025 RepID=UPI00068BDE99|nr:MULTISPECIES: alpha/beta fold hydrolase [Rhodococcus]